MLSHLSVSVELSDQFSAPANEMTSRIIAIVGRRTVRWTHLETLGVKICRAMIKRIFWLKRYLRWAMRQVRPKSARLQGAPLLELSPAYGRTPLTTQEAQE